MDIPTVDKVRFESPKTWNYPTLNATWLYMRECCNVTGKEINVFSSQYLWHAGKLYECCYRKNCDGQRNTHVAIAKIATRGLYSLSGKTSYRQISWSLEAARLDAIMIVSLWNLTGISAALPPRCLSNFRAIGKVYSRISRLRDFTWSCGKTSCRLVNRGPGCYFDQCDGMNVAIVTIGTENHV